jgi:hypothetical protein
MSEKVCGSEERVIKLIIFEFREGSFYYTLVFITLH